MESSKLPLEFDPDFYRNAHPDLRSMCGAELATHFQLFGAAEGRVCSPYAWRGRFLELVKAEASVLEIGPFCQPTVAGPNVRYFDVLDSAGLRERAHKIGYSINSVPQIDYVSPNGDLSIVDRKFSAVVSSHCIEHQPDLVRHLQLVARLLEPGGKYYLLVPDKRYCFDALIAPSTLAGVLDAYDAKHTAHRLASVLEHRALTTHNDAARHWQGDHVDPSYTIDMVRRYRTAMDEFTAAAGGYFDVHAWQFTPLSFRHICSGLQELGLISLAVGCVHSTPRSVFEFTAILTNDAQR